MRLCVGGAAALNLQNGRQQTIIHDETEGEQSSVQKERRKNTVPKNPIPTQELKSKPNAFAEFVLGMFGIGTT